MTLYQGVCGCSSGKMAYLYYNQETENGEEAEDGFKIVCAASSEEVTNDALAAGTLESSTKPIDCMSDLIAAKAGGKCGCGEDDKVWVSESNTGEGKVVYCAADASSHTFRTNGMKLSGFLIASYYAKTSHIDSKYLSFGLTGGTQYGALETAQGKSDPWLLEMNSDQWAKCEEDLMEDKIVDMSSYQFPQFQVDSENNCYIGDYQATEASNSTCLQWAARYGSVEYEEEETAGPRANIAASTKGTVDLSNLKVKPSL